MASRPQKHSTRPGQARSAQVHRLPVAGPIAATVILGGRILTDSGGFSTTAVEAQADEVAALGALWHRWGTRTPEHLEGAFAFVVSDPQRGSVFLVRDPMGEVPCYYAVVGDEVIASASLDELLAELDVDREVDLEAVALRLARCHRELLRRTDYRSIRKAAPGTVTELRAGSINETTYWRPESVTTNRGLSFDDAVELGDAVVRQAVERRLPSGTVAAHLSGGLDSGTVAAMATAILNDRGRSLGCTYSWSPAPAQMDVSGPLRDERAVVLRTAAHLGAEVRFNDMARLQARWSAGVDLLDDPPMAWRIEADHAHDAATRGVMTILTGWGGDEGISHHSRLVSGELLRRGRPGSAWAATAPAFDRELSTARRLQAMLRAAITPASVSPTTHPDVDELEAWRAYSPAVADAISAQRAHWSSGRTTRERMLARITHGHLTMRNESWARGGSRLGLSYRSPLLDRRVLEFALSLPPEFFTSGGATRRFFRAIAARHLPPGGAEVTKTVESNPALGRLLQDFNPYVDALARQDGLARGWPPALVDAAFPTTRG